MKCEQAQEYIALAAWGELPDEVKLQLEQHLEVCAACRQELEAVQGLVKAMALLPAEEPSANMLARARLKLEEALDALPRENWLVRMSQRFTLGMSRLRSAPVMASTLLVFGIAAGAYGGYRVGAHVHNVAQTALILKAAQQNAVTAQIANVSSIEQVPNSDDIVVNYNRLVPDSIKGSLNDPQIRQLLLLGVRNPATPDVRDDSVGLLADQCQSGNLCDAQPVRSALMMALLYDKSPSVRMKALDGLQPYVGADMQVRDAVLEALMNDSDAQIRAEAISLLAPVEADSSVRDVLHTVATQDSNAHIRDVSQQVLDAAPQIQ
ncbi:MAG TPA: zf-HC2 domain-containing protein [Acidobacteriaceae bacterium]|nr:zf-HC2 domain-containing protein [Acidobacteriaceae bacterium]